MPSHKLILVGERPFYFFESYYATVGWANNRFPSALVWLSRNHNSKFYYEERDTSPQKRLWEYVLKNPKFLNSIKNNFDERRATLVRFFNGLDTKKASDRQLFDAYKILVEFYRDYQGEGNAYARLVDRYGLQILRRELQKQKVDDVESAITTLTSASRESYLAKEERIFWQGVLKAKTPRQLARFFAHHLWGCAWVGRSYMEEPPLSMSDLKKRLANVPKAARRKKLAHLAGILKHNSTSRGQLIKACGLNKMTIKYAAILRESLFLKDFIRGVLAEVYYHSDTLFDELERRMGLRRAAIKDLTIEEFKNVFLHHGKPDKKLLAKRARGPYLVSPVGRAAKVMYGQAVQKFEKRYLLDNSLSKLQELRGRPASAGEAVGNVRVVHTWNEMKTFKKGEVLVVNNTNPAFVPYLHKVAAIVAAEGGVTVHAAIISREMGIPCVIGIRDVTRLLKTGQLVHVDAAKGLVEKLGV